MHVKAVQALFVLKKERKKESKKGEGGREGEGESKKRIDEVRYMYMYV